MQGSARDQVSRVPGCVGHHQHSLYSIAPICDMTPPLNTTMMKPLRGTIRAHEMACVRDMSLYMKSDRLLYAGAFLIILHARNALDQAIQEEIPRHFAVEGAERDVIALGLCCDRRCDIWRCECAHEPLGDIGCS